MNEEFPAFHHESGPNLKKTREAILYVAGKTGFGLTRLNKALWRADFDAYAEQGQSITRQEYHHVSFGPGLRALPKVLRVMQEQGDIDVAPAEDFEERRVIPHRDADPSVLSTAELSYLDRAIAILAPMGAKEASDWSHEFPGWKLTEDRETIPYEWVFWSEEPLTADEISYGLSLELAL